jgi:hypothetical protein
MSSSVHQPLMLLFSLSDTPRNQLLEWYEDVCAQVRGLCAAFDIDGTLSLVAYPSEWNAYPGNITNAADVLANGDPPDFRAWPTFANPLIIPTMQRWVCYQCTRGQWTDTTPTLWLVVRLT